jgi:hypothetical protein
MPTFRMHKPDERRKLRTQIEGLINLEKKEIDRIDHLRSPHIHHIQELQQYLKNQRSDDQLLQGINRHKGFLETTWELSLKTVEELPCFTCKNPCDDFSIWRKEHTTSIPGSAKERS